MLFFAIFFITAALIFYTIGVWGEKLRSVLMLRHLLFFWSGFCCDCIGTFFMSTLAGPGVTMSFHTVTGMIAIFLMLFHAGWATFTWLYGTDKAKENFHKFSIAVWVIWLIPYTSGMLMGMGII